VIATDSFAVLGPFSMGVCSSTDNNTPSGIRNQELKKKMKKNETADEQIIKLLLLGKL
jgi:hypothetical protein